jgi:TRAP-type uncharacterized transport system substrate-binding protein
MYPGIDSDTLCINCSTVYATRKDLPEDIGYGIAKAFVKSIDAWGDVMAAMKGMKAKDLANIPEDMLIHPGAKKYYKEIGAMK